jgi:hypothetical protein
LANIPSFDIFLLAKLGRLEHLQNDAGFQATNRVLKKLGLDGIEINTKSAEPREQQFWEQFDVIFELSEDELVRELPTFITDPTNRSKVEALLAGRKREAVGHEESKQISANLDH